MSKQLRIGNKMYDIISEGDNNTVIKWQDNTVAKLFKLGNKQAHAELELLQLANLINDLVVKAITIEHSPCYIYDMLLMERLTILDKRTLSLSERKSLLSKFKSQLDELHQLGFVHGDIKRPLIHKKGDIWDNICITPNGIRLIDVGCSSLTASPNIDIKDFNEFAIYLLS